MVSRQTAVKGSFVGASAANRTLLRVGQVAAVVLAVVAVGASLVRYALPDALHQQLVRPLYGEDFTANQIPRYQAHPLITFLHVVPGSFIILSGFAQFSQSLRRRRPSLHRWLGRAHVASALVVSAAALAILAIYPFAGLNEVVPVVFFMVIYVYALAMGAMAARARRFVEHREWMVRAFGISLGVAAVRLIFVAFLYTVRASQYENFGVSMWAGFGVSLLCAEVWVQRTRVDKAVFFEEPVPVGAAPEVEAPAAVAAARAQPDRRAG